MNKFIFFSLLLVSELFVTSCNDDLDLKSDGSITMAEVFTDRNRTRGYLNGCYGFLPSPYLEAVHLQMMQKIVMILLLVHDMIIGIMEE